MSSTNFGSGQTREQDFQSSTGMRDIDDIMAQDKGGREPSTYSHASAGNIFENTSSRGGHYPSHDMSGRNTFLDNPSTTGGPNMGGLAGSGAGEMHTPLSANLKTSQSSCTGACDQAGCPTCMGSRQTVSSAAPIVPGDITVATEPVGHSTGGYQSTGHHMDSSVTDRGFGGSSDDCPGDIVKGDYVEATGVNKGTPKSGLTETGMPEMHGDMQNNTSQSGRSMGTRARPSMADKVLGGAEKMVGKMTRNENMQMHGEERVNVQKN